MVKKRSKSEFAVGTSDFKNVIEGGFYYVDKSLLIQKIQENPDHILLLPRPRRFGKTTNLSMLRYFYEKSEESRISLFEGLAISKQKAVMAHQGQFPVIYLTFKDIKETDWESCLEQLQRLMSRVCREFAPVNQAMFSPADQNDLNRLLEGKASKSTLAASLRLLVDLLYEAHGTKVIVLIDEYDVPIHAGYQYGYYDEVIAFIRNFMSGAFKDNSHLEKGVITGILKVAKESVFSGLNNLRTHSLLSPDFADDFGFTEAEVREVLKNFHLQKEQSQVQLWYNGYDFGGSTIYNPWSIIQYANSPHLGLMPYWLNSGSYDIIKGLVNDSSPQVQKKIEQLIQGESVESSLNESIVFRDIQASSEHIFSFLVFSGYLKASNPHKTAEDTKWTYDLEIPNREVSIFYQDVIRQWLHEGIGSSRLEQMLRSLLEKEFEDFESYFDDMVRQFLSFYDTAGEEPEKVYHAFVLGLLMNLQTQYLLRSNREAGYGRYDLSMIPRDPEKPGFILEFKKINHKRKETPEIALQSALDQVLNKHYADELREHGVTDITAFGIVIDQKQTWMQWKSVS